MVVVLAALAVLLLPEAGTVLLDHDRARLPVAGEGIEVLVDPRHGLPVLAHEHLLRGVLLEEPDEVGARDRDVRAGLERLVEGRESDARRVRPARAVPQAFMLLEVGRGVEAGRVARREREPLGREEPALGKERPPGFSEPV